MITRDGFGIHFGGERLELPPLGFLYLSSTELWGHLSGSVGSATHDI